MGTNIINEDLSTIPTWATPQNNDIVEEIQWWEAQNIPWQIARELRRRNNSNNIGQFGTTNSTFNFKVDHPKYKGPMTPWVRAFSNGTGNIVNPEIPTSKYLLKNGKMPTYDGFELRGGEGFGNAYGFQNKNGAFVEDKAIIGYEANGSPHYIDTTYRSQMSYTIPDDTKFPQNATAPSVLPPPGITSISIKTNRDMMSNAIIHWKCYSLAQLEYMMPFWLSPKINVFLEIGWNLFNNESLLNLIDKDECYGLILRPELAVERYYKSFGNYGLITGIISKYNFSTDDGFVYSCNTEIISRQAMYAGFRVENPTVSETNGVDDRTFLDIKTCLVTYLPQIDQVVATRSNFINFINYTRKVPPTKYDTKPTILEYIGWNRGFEQTSIDFKDYYFPGKQIDEPTKTTGMENRPKFVANAHAFYNGKKENRIFMGRREDVYNAHSIPTEVNIEEEEDSRDPTNKRPMIEYGTTTGAVHNKIVSSRDKNDFDPSDGNDEVWLQLDFVFELINHFCAEKNTKFNKIDISNFIVSAHPNLISCDKNVLIPNSVAPKINIGTSHNAQNPDGGGGYLEPKETSENPFMYQYYSENFDESIKIGEAKLKAGETNTSTVGVGWKAARKAKLAFKTRYACRDNLDIIINKLYYQLYTKSKTSNFKVESAAFPFKETVNTGNREYPAYYHGYLKHVYISKGKLINIGEDDSVKTLQQLVNKILNVINESVDNFWNFEVVNNPLGGLSIMDKNITMSKKTPIYQFELGSTSNMIKKISFDVNMTNQQVNQVLYGSNQNASTTAKSISEVEKNTALTTDNKIERITQIGRSVAGIAYSDRFDNLQLQHRVAETIASLESEMAIAAERGSSVNITDTGVPHSVLENRNNDVRMLQIYGEKFKDVLVMCIRALGKSNPYGPPPPPNPRKPKPDEGLGWVYLNLPPILKPKLREMLDDGDIENNTARYAGPADNFTITLTFDGIFGFQMFQHFAISNLPKPYVPGNVIFMVSEVEHQLNAGTWETIVTAMLKPANYRNLTYVPL